MGGNSTSREQQNSSAIDLYISHPKFKDVKYISQSELIRSNIDIQHESDYQIWQTKLNKIASIDDEVLLLPKAYSYTRKAICGSSGRIQIDYDNYPYILADEIENRKKIGKYFTEPQIWYLLYSLVTAAHDFQKINQRIGDVKPQNIFINEQGQIKVSNLYSWPGQVSNRAKKTYDSERTLLSPQQADSFRQGKSQTFMNKYKSQSFTIGLTIIQTAMLKNLDFLYRNSKSFDYNSFNEIIKQWWALLPRLFQDQNNNAVKIVPYSDSLKLTVAGLCQIKPEQRLNSDEVYQWLKRFHRQINQIIPFEPGLPPVKTIKKYSHLLQNNNLVNTAQYKVNANQPRQEVVFNQYSNQQYHQNNPNIRYMQNNAQGLPQVQSGQYINQVQQPYPVIQSYTPPPPFPTGQPQAQLKSPPQPQPKQMQPIGQPQPQQYIHNLHPRPLSLQQKITNQNMMPYEKQVFIKYAQPDFIKQVNNQNPNYSQPQVQSKTVNSTTSMYYNPPANGIYQQTTSPASNSIPNYAAPSIYTPVGAYNSSLIMNNPEKKNVTIQQPIMQRPVSQSPSNYLPSGPTSNNYYVPIGNISQKTAPSDKFSNQNNIINRPGTAISSSQVKTNQFLRNIDEKLNLLKQEFK